jgi:class 3 adenylate cyclase
MRLFENYTIGINKILSEGEFSSFTGPNNKRAKSVDILKANESVRMFAEQNVHLPLAGDKVLLDFDRSGLEKLFGPNKSSFSNITIGSHPDFSDIAHDGFCYHHCVSMFVDIKGSTRLGLKHSLEKVRLIKDSMLTLCIHVANFFGGHVHRLQGDGVFVQFVRKGGYKNDAIINALNAASVLCQFVERDLSEIFTKKGLNPIKIRIGIDFGKDEEVLWSHYGIPGCAELTTTSLHTDLAAKLQGKAKSNAIVIGGNIVDELDLPEEYYGSVFRTVNGSEDLERYIIRDICYRQFDFDWKKYLQSYDFVRRSDDGKNLDIEERVYKIICEIADEDGGQRERYYQNSGAIPKGKKIFFNITYRNHPYTKQPFERVTWEAFNRGAEAKDNLHHDYGGSYKNLTYCETSAAYLGHHYVNCKIIRENLPNINMTLPLYVR